MHLGKNFATCSGRSSANDHDNDDDMLRERVFSRVCGRRERECAARPVPCPPHSPVAPAPVSARRAAVDLAASLDTSAITLHARTSHSRSSKLPIHRLHSAGPSDPPLHSAIRHQLGEIRQLHHMSRYFFATRSVSVAQSSPQSATAAQALRQTSHNELPCSS